MSRRFLRPLNPFSGERIVLVSHVDWRRLACGRLPRDVDANVETDSQFETPIHSIHEAGMVLGKYGKCSSGKISCSVATKNRHDNVKCGCPCHYKSL